MLDAHRVRVVDGVADAPEDSRPLPELERGAQPAELESFDLLHDDDRRVGGRTELEDADDARIGEQGQGLRLAQQ